MARDTVVMGMVTAKVAEGESSDMKRLFLALIIILVFMPGPATAEYVTLGWDANSDSLDGYIVYRSLASGSGYVYMDTIPCTAGDPVCCEYIGEQLPWSTNFYWVVTAFKGIGETFAESGFSNEVSYTTPAPPLIPPKDPTGCFIKAVNP